MGHPQVHDPLRLTGAEIERLLAQLNRHGSSQSKRRHRRWLFNRQKGVLTLTNDKGDPAVFVMVPRNLSRSGVALLHGGFVHNGTRCMLGLRGSDGVPRSLAATVVRCRCVEGRVHDLGVVLDHEVNPRDFSIMEMDEHRFDAETVDPRTLSGRVLVVSGEPNDAEFIGSVFDGTEVEVRPMSSGPDALVRLADKPALAFVSATLGDMKGVDWMKQARAKDAELSVVILLDKTELDKREEALAEGAIECLSRPLNEALIVQAVADALGRSPEEQELIEAARKIPKDLSPEDAEKLMSEFRHLGRELSKAVEADDAQGAENAAKQLRWAAEGTGFDVLLSAARQAHDGLSQRKKIPPVMAAVRRAVRLCEHMRGDPPRGESTGSVATELAA